MVNTLVSTDVLVIKSDVDTKIGLIDGEVLNKSHSGANELILVVYEWSELGSFVEPFDVSNYGKPEVSLLVKLLGSDDGTVMNFSEWFFWWY